MTDLQRLDQCGSPLARTLLRAGRAEAPAPHVAARAARALGIATTVVGLATAAGQASAAAATTAAATASATVGAPAAGAVTVGLVAKWTGVGMLLGLGALGAVDQLSSSPPDTAPRAAAPVRAATAQPAAHPIADPLPPPPDEPLPEPPPNATATRAQPKPPTAKLPDAPSSLAQEVRSLEAARAALSSGDPNGALAALDRYAQSSGTGRLSMEADYLRMESLHRQGNRPAAAAAARRLLRANPSGPHAARARSIAGMQFEGSEPEPDGIGSTRQR